MMEFRRSIPHRSSFTRSASQEKSSSQEKLSQADKPSPGESTPSANFGPERRPKSEITQTVLKTIGDQ